MSTVQNIKLENLSPKQRKYIEKSNLLNTLYESIQEKGNENKSALQTLVDKSGSTIYLDSGLLFEHGGHLVTMSQLLQFYDHVIGRAGRCPICRGSITEGCIIAHLESGYDQGHTLTKSEIILAFVNAEDN